MSTGSGEWRGFPVKGGRGSAFLAGVVITSLSGLLFAYLYQFTLTNRNIPNYYWVKITTVLSNPEILIPISGFVIGTVLIVLGVLLPRPNPKSK